MEPPEIALETMHATYNRLTSLDREIMINVNCEVDGWSKDDSLPDLKVLVKNHWNISDRVQLVIDGTGGHPVRCFVNGSDLIAAVRNAMDTNRNS